MTSSTWLEACERARQERAPLRPLVLLGAADPSADREGLARLSLGQRDRRLFALREALFGADIEAVADCPACGQRLEAAFRRPPDAAADTVDVAGPFTLDVEQWHLECRPPDTLDLVAAAECSSVAAARSCLLERCVRVSDGAGRALAPAELPLGVRSVVEDALDRKDPGAAVTVALSCPSCAHEWEALFDIGDHLWHELERWTARLLHEVHLLASAYGWSEREILELPPSRRARYLGLVEAMAR